MSIFNLCGFNICVNFCFRCWRGQQEGSEGHPYSVWPNSPCRWPQALRAEEIRWSRCQSTLPKVVPLITKFPCKFFFILFNKIEYKPKSGIYSFQTSQFNIIITSYVFFLTDTYFIGIFHNWRLHKLRCRVGTECLPYLEFSGNFFARVRFFQFRRKIE